MVAETSNHPGGDLFRGIDFADAVDSRFRATVFSDSRTIDRSGGALMIKTLLQRVWAGVVALAAMMGVWLGAQIIARVLLPRLFGN
jgi:hypothetical protein